MKNIKFQPRVGTEYSSGGIFGRRIMVLGESHYCGERWIDGEDIKVDGSAVDNGCYLLAGGKKVRAVCVYHPSVGYSWDYWYKAITVIAGDNSLPAF